MVVTEVSVGASHTVAFVAQFYFVFIYVFRYFFVVVSLYIYIKVYMNFIIFSNEIATTARTKKKNYINWKL